MIRVLAVESAKTYFDTNISDHHHFFIEGENDVLDMCRAKLARFKVPKRVVFYRAEDLPTTPTGKVQKYKLVRQLTSTRR